MSSGSLELRFREQLWWFSTRIEGLEFPASDLTTIESVLKKSRETSARAFELSRSSPHVSRDSPHNHFVSKLSTQLFPLDSTLCVGGRSPPTWLKPCWRNTTTPSTPRSPRSSACPSSTTRCARWQASRATSSHSRAASGGDPTIQRAYIFSLQAANEGGWGLFLLNGNVWFVFGERAQVARMPRAARNRAQPAREHTRGKRRARRAQRLRRQTDDRRQTTAIPSRRQRHRDAKYARSEREKRARSPRRPIDLSFRFSLNRARAPSETSAATTTTTQAPAPHGGVGDETDDEVPPAFKPDRVTEHWERKVEADEALALLSQLRAHCRS